jgi:hypothetical protein
LSLVEFLDGLEFGQSSGPSDELLVSRNENSHLSDAEAVIPAARVRRPTRRRHDSTAAVSLLPSPDVCPHPWRRGGLGSEEVVRATLAS